MQIAITGATGFLGTALRARLEAEGHTVLPISRRPGPGTVVWDPAAGTIDAAALRGVDGVVHLAGEGIASGPHTESRKQKLLDSRVDGTRTIAEAIAGLDEGPAVLLSASAMGFYGDRGDEVLAEGAGPGRDYLADLCVAWERSTAPAEDAGIRTAHLRTSIVLDAKGGALAKQLPLFKLGLGAKAGRGDQWLSWITLDDHLSAMVHLLTHDVAGPVNLATPNPVTNTAFTKAVAGQLGRPAFLSIPRLVSRAPFGVGDLVRSLLFTSARLEPTALEASGFTFAHPTLDDALPAVLGR